MDRDRLQGHLDAGLSVAKIAEVEARHPSTVSYWLQVHGLTANGAKHGRCRTIDIAELTALVDRGLTIRQIADHLSVSKSTVNRNLLRQGIRRRSSSRREAAIAARTQGETRFKDVCLKHGESDFLAFPDGKSRCVVCNSEAVARRRRKVKEILVAEAGGACVICGFDKHPAALQFHHLDPTTKSHGIAQAGLTRSIELTREEAAKCALLCANCHAIVEVGALSVPLELGEAAVSE